MPKPFSAASGSIRTQLLDLLESAKLAYGDKRISLREAVDLGRKSYEAAMRIVDSLGDNAAKKALVLEFAGLLFDLIAPLIIGRWTMVGWLLFIFGGQDFVKERYLELVSVLVEALLARMKGTK